MSESGVRIEGRGRKVKERPPSGRLCRLDTEPNRLYARVFSPWNSPLETSLYLPVKTYLEGLGFEVKGEIMGCDLVALRDGEAQAVVIGELKQSFTLELVLQAVDRSASADEVWLAVKASVRGRGREHDSRVRKLCRLCGFGLLSVLPMGGVEVVVEPVPWKPRHDGKRRSRIVAEHRRRRGDPALGGSTRRPIMTAYRQRTLAMARALAAGPLRPRDLTTLAADAPAILTRNVYGWFERQARGLYRLSQAGQEALATWKDHLTVAPPE